jgi:hypothetical protein
MATLKSKTKPRSTARPRPKTPAKKTKPGSRARAPQGKEIPPSTRKFARAIWPQIKTTTIFVEVPEYRTIVTYTLPSGDPVTAVLKWYSVSHGPRILGHFDDANDVCYIGKFIEG